jgi:hypothetical protein
MATVARPQGLKCAPSSQSSERKTLAAISVAPGPSISTSTGGVKVVTKILISPWQRKPNHPRYYVTSGREPLGTVFESRGVFSAIGVDGRLVGSSTSLKIAVDSLCPGASSS